MPRSIHTDEYRKLTAILSKARKASGLTQQDVANRLGKPQSYVAKVEGNERRIDVVEFISFARSLGSDPMHLFGAVLSEMKNS